MGKKYDKLFAMTEGVMGSRLTSEISTRIKDDGVREWGAWAILDQEARYKVKRIVIKPGKTLSFQRHAHRNEMWRVVVGSLEAHVESVDEEWTDIFSEGDGFTVMAGAWHQVRNPGKIHAVAIEVQTGAYLEEDDIERDPHGPFDVDGDDDESDA